MMKVLPLLVFLLPFLAVAQTATINGRVEDEHHQPLDFVNIVLLTSTDTLMVKGINSDSQGLFKLNQIEQGRYVLRAQFIGYKNAYAPVEVGEGTASIEIPTLILYEDTQILKEVTVRGNRPLVEQFADKLVVNVENSILASGGSAIELLEKSPGVSLDSNDGLSISGKAGVLVLINGKPTQLPPSELATYLRSLSANTIASIEVITSPGARFDAAGNAGVINIVLKKNNQQGLGGTFSQNIGRGRFSKANTALQINYNTGKLNVFGMYAYSFNDRFFDLSIYREIEHEGTVSIFDQRNYQPGAVISHNWQAGVDLTLSKKQTLTMATTGTKSHRSIDVVNSTLIYSEGKTDRIDMENLLKAGWNSVGGSFNYRLQLNQPQQVLTVDGDINHYTFSQNDHIQLTATNSPSLPTNLTSDMPTEITVQSLRSDYAQPLGSKWSMELGAKVSEVATQNQITYYNGELIDTERTNDFNYTEQIAAGYFNMRGKFRGITLNAGLRGEQTMAKGVSQLSNTGFDRTYFKLFPNLNISKAFSDNYTATLTFARRIDRPVYRDLYPFIVFLDPYTSARGNPFLQPQFTYQAQLSQTLYKSYSINLSYSYTNDLIGDVITQDNQTKVGYSMRDNVENYYNYSLQLLAPVTIHSWWSAQISTNIFYNRYKAPILNGFLDVARVSGMANVSNTFLLPWDLSAEANFIYQAPNVVNIQERQAMGQVNLGIQKRLWDKKGTVRLGVTDLFRTNRFMNSIRYEDLHIDLSQRWDSRVVQLSFTYNLGKVQTRNKRSGSEEEQRRISTQ